MQIEVVMPKMGESIQEGKILRWLKKPGDKVEKDETLLEISTDKVDSEIPSPSGGILAKIVIKEQETVDVGTVIAYIESDEKVTVLELSTDSEATAAVSEAEKPAVNRMDKKVDHVEDFGDRFYSPLVRAIAGKEGISSGELQKIPGSGSNGRLTKKDILEYLDNRSTESAKDPVSETSFEIRKIGIAELREKYPDSRFEIRQMDNVQLKMAEHMVRSAHTSAHVSAASECDVTAIVEYREAHAEAFEKKEGYKLTYTPFVIVAAIKALKDFPVMNSSIVGDKIVIKKEIHFGMAVASPTGLIVPVISNAEEKNFIGISRAVFDLATRTRNRKLKLEEIQGGTFTITNYGVFGNIFGTPIINQPQVGILGIGAIKKRPVVMTDGSGNDVIGIRSMAILSISFDHRVIDGAIGGQFVERVASYLENFDLENLY